ncbi:unnamed protein product [Mytilus coruscus]|uniref:Uncharacterized protein n=1 Tax=Mytilus coruscus TaxID=42192 RepID=A0A6J8BQ05_MYTCO|nr:unnamed protein product [Mytilus coruscus]
METQMTFEERFLETLVSSEHLKQIVLSLKDDGSFRKISKLKSIGQIEVEMRPSEVVMTGIKGKQAQLEVDCPRRQVVFKILPDGRLVLSCRGSNLVRFFSSDGNKEFEILLKPSNVMDITIIPKDNTIAATSGGDGSRHYINVIDIKDRKVGIKISMKYSYYGVAYKDSTLITCALGKGLHKYESDEVYGEFTIKEMSSFSYVAAFNNRIYYTNVYLHTVTCCDKKGQNFGHSKKKVF